MAVLGIGTNGIAFLSFRRLGKKGGAYRALNGRIRAPEAQGKYNNLFAILQPREQSLPYALLGHSTPWRVHPIAFAVL